MNAGAASPFSGRTVLAMLLFGALAFVMALYFIGAGETGRGTNDGGAHAGAKGLNGYAALAQLLERRGWEVVRSRSEAGLQSEDLVVLTPPQGMDGAEIERIVRQRRSWGPTIVILPKWTAAEAGGNVPGSKGGWVVLGEPVSPGWSGFADDVPVGIGKASGWSGAGMAGTLPKPASVQWAGSSDTLSPVITASGEPDHVLAGYLNDASGESGGDLHSPHTVLLVFEPDLIDNLGMARGENAVLADRLFAAMAQGHARRVHFDLTLNGLGRTDNLLTLAFTPPFLAATLCLLLAALVIAWRALRRFGPPMAQARAIAFGKRQLLRNSAGLILRTRRFHLLGAPYAALLRPRIARLLGLRPTSHDGELDLAIDRALATRGFAPFTTDAQTLRHARKPHELLRAAQALKDLERTLGK
jgi:hypothetical protein